jgi:predicted nucleic acid-binding protein
MLYVDTSVLVALCTNEAKTVDVVNWYAACTDELASAAWCVTEFASALGIKQRTGQLTESQAKATSMVTLDAVLAKNAKRHKLKLVAVGRS